MSYTKSAIKSVAYFLQIVSTLSSTAQDHVAFADRTATEMSRTMINALKSRHPGKRSSTTEYGQKKCQRASLSMTITVSSYFKAKYYEEVLLSDVQPIKAQSLETTHPTKGEADLRAKEVISGRSTGTILGSFDDGISCYLDARKQEIALVATSVPAECFRYLGDYKVAEMGMSGRSSVLTRSQVIRLVSFKYVHSHEIEEGMIVHVLDEDDASGWVKTANDHCGKKIVLGPCLVISGGISSDFAEMKTVGKTSRRLPASLVKCLNNLRVLKMVAHWYHLFISSSEATSSWLEWWRPPCLSSLRGGQEDSRYSKIVAGRHQSPDFAV
ncbi:hypothetical protein J3A83DRAFT_4433692 [Scleroderma citrinum]